MDKHKCFIILHASWCKQYHLLQKKITKPFSGQNMRNVAKYYILNTTYIICKAPRYKNKAFSTIT